MINEHILEIIKNLDEQFFVEVGLYILNKIKSYSNEIRKLVDYYNMN